MRRKSAISIRAPIAATSTGASSRLPAFGAIRRSLCRRTKLLHLIVGRHHARAVDILEIRHGALAVLERDLADVGADRRLMILGSIGERAQRTTLDLEAAESSDQL